MGKIIEAVSKVPDKIILDGTRITQMRQINTEAVSKILSKTRQDLSINGLRFQNEFRMTL